MSMRKEKNVNHCAEKDAFPVSNYVSLFRRASMTVVVRLII